MKNGTFIDWSQTSLTRKDRIGRVSFSVSSIFVYITSFVYTPDTHSWLPILCPIRRATGHLCPGCGLTRAFSAITHGQFALAFQYHPFSFLLYAVGLYMLLRFIVELHKNRKIKEGRHCDHLLVFVAGLWVLWWLVR